MNPKKLSAIVGVVCGAELLVVAVIGGAGLSVFGDRLSALIDTGEVFCLVVVALGVSGWVGYKMHAARKAKSGEPDFGADK